MKLRLIFGQVMVELLLALAVSSLALVAMAQVATKSLANSGYSRNRSEANKYAVEAIEWIRGQRADWATFTSHNSGTYCMGNIGFIACSGNNDIVTGTIFSRKMVFTKAAGQVTADITVSWNEKGNPVISKQTIIFKQY